MLPARNLGAREVAAVALGSARWALEAQPDIDRATRTLRAALEAGVTLVDTAPAYTPPGHPGLAEEVIGRVLRGPLRSGDVLVATKGGHWRVGEQFPVDARPEVLHRQCRESLARLGIDAIDLYLLHWPDPSVPIEESVGALAELNRSGLVRGIGVCNVDANQFERASTVWPLDAVQNPFSPLDATGTSVLEAAARTRTTFLAYSPMGGSPAAQSLAERLPAFAAAAQRMGVSVHEVCIAWLLSRSPSLIPIVGAGRPESIASAARASTMSLSTAALVELGAEPMRSVITG